MKLSDAEEDTIWTVYEKVENGTLAKEKGLKTYESILRAKIRFLSPPKSPESLVTLSQQLFEFVRATSGEHTTDSTTKTKKKEEVEKRDKEENMKSSKSTVPVLKKTAVEKSPKDINLSLQIEQVRLECETEQYRAEIFERKYKQLKMTHNQELNVSKSRLSEVESRIQSFSNDMEYARKEWNEARTSETRLAAALKESDVIIGNEAKELNELRNSIKRVTTRCKKESVAAKRWMSQRQIAQVAAKAAEAKTQRLKEEANEATTRANELDAKCRAAIKSAASSYDKFMHASKCESDLQRANGVMRDEVARREDMVRDEETAKERLESALSKAKTELERWRERHSRSESAERELRKRIEENRDDLKRKVCEYEIDREQSKEDFDELWKELCRSKELMREMETEARNDVEDEKDARNDVEDEKDALVISNGAIDLLRELKGLASELENAKCDAKSNAESNSNDVLTPPPPLPTDDVDNDSEMLREALLRQETMTSNVLNEFETHEALTQSLRRENEIQLETNSRQKAALVALQISLKEEIELARSRSAFRDDSILQEEEAMAQLLESRREYSDLGRRDDLVRSDLLHANAEILALRKEITAERTNRMDFAREHLFQHDEIVAKMSTVDGIINIVPSDLVESTELMTKHIRASQLACQELKSKLSRSESEMEGLSKEMKILKMNEKRLRSETVELEEATRKYNDTSKLDTELQNYRRALQVSIQEIVERDDEILQEKSKIRMLSKEVDEVRDALRVLNGSSTEKRNYLKGLIGSMHSSPS